MHDVSVGLFAHNEEANIRRCLKAICSQKGDFRIKEILVISSSDDKTDSIVGSFKDKRVRLVKEKERLGKCHAINCFLGSATSKVLIMESADTFPESGCYHYLLKPFSERTIGMTNARPVPIRGTALWDSVGKIIWDIHHQVNLKSPKVGELVAFRNIIPRITETAVDEESIAALFRRMGYGIAYCPKAIVWNKAPQGFRDYLRQRRRIHCGHLQLRKECGTLGTVPTLHPLRVMRSFAEVIDIKNPHTAMIGLGSEIFARFMGRLDYVTGKDYTRWETASSTKDLGSS
jgi:glycosyltransferase involved in cell wall biosynthesis